MARSSPRSTATPGSQDRRRAAKAVAKKLGLEDVEAIKAQIEQALYAHGDD
jgi:hypothetical protein